MVPLLKVRVQGEGLGQRLVNLLKVAGLLIVARDGWAVVLAIGRHFGAVQQGVGCDRSD